MMFALPFLLTPIAPVGESPTNELAPFALALSCLDRQSRCPFAEYSAQSEAILREPAARWGRNRHEYQAAAEELRLAGYAWYCLASIRNERPADREYWIYELRVTIGADAFRAGVMPPFPWVRVSE